MARKKKATINVGDLGNGYARLVSGRLGRPVSEAVVRPEDSASFYAE